MDPSAAVAVVPLDGVRPSAASATTAPGGSAAPAPAASTASSADATAAPAAATPGSAVPAALPDASATAPASAGTTPVSPSVAAQPVPPGASAPAAGSPGETIASPGSAGANPQSIAPRTTPVHDGTPSDSLPNGPQNEASTPTSTPTAATAGAAKGSSATAPAGDAPPQAAAPSAPAAAALAPPLAPQQLDAATSASATLPSRGVGLDRAVETVRLALRAAADRGVTHARISLNPRELGGIEIHLRHTADGLVARVVAEHGGAAQLLQHAGAELRRSLEAQGVKLLQLDIGASAEQGGQAAGEQRGFGETGPRRDGGGDPAADGAAASGETAPNGPASTLALSNGVLVDVLA
jgi:flagellar hook-length control protein FliK